MAGKQTGKPSAKKELHCPFCDEEIRQLNLPWCQACGVTIAYCSTCGKPIGKDKNACPHCGAKISAK
jgi:DNA-directed RNA polymerase subunit RPC12/RpoP